MWVSGVEEGGFRMRLGLSSENYNEKHWEMTKDAENKGTAFTIQQPWAVEEQEEKEKRKSKGVITDPN